VSRVGSSQISFADWELMRQGLAMEPLLEAISGFLDEQAELVLKVGGDLRQGLKKPDTGRNGMTPQEVLRSLILTRVKNWDYRELRERIADGYTLRQFTGFNCRPVPKHNAFQRAFVRLTPETLKAVNDLVVEAAVDLGLEDGAKLRVDTTVVQTDIHHPTDNTLLWDAVRVLTRLLVRLGSLLGRRLKGFRDRTRAARRRMQAIQRMSATQRQWQQTGKYRELIAIAEQVVACARSALKDPRNARGKGLVLRPCDPGAT
jgi:IS5 family transposase